MQREKTGTMKGRKIRLVENIQRATLKVMLRTEGLKKKVLSSE